MSQTPRRQISDISAMFLTCSCKHRRCIFDVIILRMTWVLHRRCSRTTRRCYGNVFACVLYFLYPPSNAPTEQNWSVLYPWSHLAVIRYVVQREISPPFMLSTRHYNIAMTSSRHQQYAPEAFVCRTPNDHRPSPILKVHRQLLADVAPINPRIFPHASPNIRQNVGDTSQKVRQYIACVFSRGSTRSTSTSPPEYVFFIASTSPDILVIVGW